MLENEEFWKNFFEGEDDSSANADVPSAEPTLNPGYRTANKPTTTDPPKSETELSMEDLLADLRKLTSSIININSTDIKSASSPQKAEPLIPKPKKVPTGSTDAHTVLHPKAETKPAVPIPNRAVTPPNNAPVTTPHSSGEDRQAMENMTAAMRELTEELRNFRNHVGSDVSHKPKIGIAPDLSAPNEDYEDDSLSAYDEQDAEIITEKVTDKKKANKIISIVGNVIFYLTIVIIIGGAFLIRSSAKGKPFLFAGYSAATILTSSMEDVYPKDSLIITKTVEPNELKLGDDITFMINEDTSVTHRIVDIIKDPVTGDYLFETKGTNNTLPDKDKVSQINIVGKVVYSSKALGNVANFIRKNWPFLIFVLIVIIVLIIVLKRIFREETSDPKDDNQLQLNNSAPSDEDAVFINKNNQTTFRKE